MIRFCITCSDSNRVGKTFLARLLSDYFILLGRPPHIFDASQTKYTLKDYLPRYATKIDLVDTAGQMAIFDCALSTLDRDCVLDLPANLLSRLLQLLDQLGFGDPAYTPEVKLVFFFLVDHSVDSILTARRLMEKPYFHVIVVKNEGVVHTFDALADHLYHSLLMERRLVIPAVEKEVWATIAKRSFSFSSFAREPLAQGSEIRSRIGRFLVTVYEQLDQIAINS
jgi:hypothetical protein